MQMPAHTPHTQASWSRSTLTAASVPMPLVFRDFPDYGYAIGSLNIVNIISVLVLFVALVLCLLGLFGITCPKCPTQLFWRRRADVNRAFVSYAVDELGRGVHYAEAIPPQSMKVSIKEWLNLVRSSRLAIDVAVFPQWFAHQRIEK